MAKAYLALGSNQGDKAAQLAEACQLLALTPGIAITARSGDYRTPPWGVTDQDWFLNACLAVETSLEPHALLDACLAVEQRMGRRRLRRWGPRSIDIDVLEIEGVGIASDRLTLPHPHLLERAFVLVPLVEIAPDLVVGGRPIHDALAGLDRTGIEPHQH